MKKILTIVGARPQFIKAAVLSNKIAKSDKFSEDILHTGQHYDPNMSDIFFEQLKIPQPKFKLNTGGGTHEEQTAQMLTGIGEVVKQNKYDGLLVYGDTNSTLAGALVASKNHIPLIHIEAGLRSFNRKMPEEVNRITTDHLSDLLFAPSETAMRNLSAEGLIQKATNVGDIMFDSTLFFSKHATPNPNLDDKSFFLVTIHRAENLENKLFLQTIFEAFKILSNYLFILPIHPRLKKHMSEEEIRIPDNLKVIPPASYLEMLWLEKKSKGILTDSGGVQKEAFFQKVPCLTLRTETEWIETVDLGWNEIANLASSISLSNQIKKLLTTKPNNSTLSPYGEGNTADKILRKLNSII